MLARPARPLADRWKKNFLSREPENVQARAPVEHKHKTWKAKFKEYIKGSFDPMPTYGINDQRSHEPISFPVIHPRSPAPL